MTDRLLQRRGAGVLLPLWDWAEDWLLVEAGAELWEELCCAEL